MAFSFFWHRYTCEQDVVEDFESHAYSLSGCMFGHGNLQPGLDERDVFSKH